MYFFSSNGRCKSSSKRSSSACFNCASIYEKFVDKNPNPSEYKIEGSKQIGNNLVVEINYPNCSNFEGKKFFYLKIAH